MQTTALKRVKDVLWALAFAGLFAAILRFALGLGATTGLNDAAPWGLWIAFKLGFVALSGGGFTLAAMVYIFHLETYRPVLRRAILLALLGYGSFIVSLIFDLGLPWHIYMPIISWQHYSVMFEIAWCVMLYFTVLILEFAPVILEHPLFQHSIYKKIVAILHYAIIPLVIAGIALSTLHQSSLGSLFLIMPHRVHPLWYSPLIPVLFFTSAIVAGLMALIVEGFIAERLFNRQPDMDLLKRLGNIGGFVLWIYLIVRLGDLFWRGVLPGSLDGSWQSILFGGEILLGGFLPAVLLMVPRIRANQLGLLTSALFAIGGILSQRMSLSLFTMRLPGNVGYRPSFLEIIIAFAIPAAAGLIYLFFSENLAVLQGSVPAKEDARHTYPVFEPGSLTLVDPSWKSRFAARSGIAVLVTAVTVAFLPGNLVKNQVMPPLAVSKASGWQVLTIDGDQDGNAVYFPHVEHQTRLAGDEDVNTACITCHHLAKPDDEVTACSECHTDFYAQTSIFNHDHHTTELGGNAACSQCHMGEHRVATAVACQECHDDMIPAVGQASFNSIASGYKDAMHGRCLNCHQSEAALQGRPDLAVCSTCHGNQIEDLLAVNGQLAVEEGQ